MSMIKPAELIYSAGMLEKANKMRLDFWNGIID